MRIFSPQILLLAIALLGAALPGCAPESVDRYHTGESSEEIVSLLNEREYGKAIWLIENREGKNPEGETAYLLGQAYLGRAGFEPLGFAAKVSDVEPDTEAARILFPKCPRERLSSLSGVEMKCLLKRVYLHAPAVDNSDFARARALFRKAYPNPELAPQWVNTLIGMVETISVVKRAGDLYVYAKNFDGNPMNVNKAEIKWFQRQGKEAFAEAKEALGRANHAGEKISKILTGTKANEWFERAEGTMKFAKTVGLSRFLDFVRENLLKPSDEIRYGETLDKLKTAFELIDN
jgi:hypothetical protein